AVEAERPIGDFAAKQAICPDDLRLRGSESQALMLTVRARALLDGRFAPSIDDVAALAPPVLKHRMALNFSARSSGETLEALIAKLVERLG
ncbi:AAA family ATPase, partial [Hansschlegelia beijingensis]